MKILFTLLTFALCAQSYGQAVLTYYYDKDGKEVYSTDNIKFKRIITPQTDGLFFIREYYSSDTLKLEGVASKYEPFLSFEGIVKSYWENGNLNEEVNYEKNRKKGIGKTYYANGQLKEVAEHFYENLPDSSALAKTKLLSYFDSIGVQQVKDGKGYSIQQGNCWVEQGKYLNGFKDSIWVGEALESSTSYQETYMNGALVSGISIKNGKNHPYSQIELMPEFEGGITTFYKFVGKTYIYPALALKKGVSGRLILSFVVEKDGRLTDIKILKDMGYGTGEAGARMLRKSPEWNPGRQRGIPVRVQYTLPISLNLTSQ